jgi:hypothetical protein
MRCVAALGVFIFATAFAQSPPDLVTLEQTAQKRHSEWETLAKDLDERMARILPCDPRSAAAITEVSRASEARMAALTEYVRGVSAQAFAETAATRILRDNEEKRALEASLERADTGQEKTAVDMQSDALAQSVKQRASLEGSQKLLEQVSAMIRARAAAADQAESAPNPSVALLRDLVTKLEARDAALREESAAFEAERVRWNGYYAARLARAQTECSITRIGLPQSKGKQ